MIRISGFDWDDSNRQKCQKHGLSLEEIEGFFLLSAPAIAPDIKHSADEMRYFAIGRNKESRPMLIVFTTRGKLIRPISARYMHEKEWKAYEKKDPAF